MQIPPIANNAYNQRPFSFNTSRMDATNSGKVGGFSFFPGSLHQENNKNQRKYTKDGNSHEWRIPQPDRQRCTENRTYDFTKRIRGLNDTQAFAYFVLIIKHVPNQRDNNRKCARSDLFPAITCHPEWSSRLCFRSASMLPHQRQHLRRLQ